MNQVVVIDDITTAKPGDLYLDPYGKVWRIENVCHEPTVFAREIEGQLFYPSLSSTEKRFPEPPRIITNARTGAINSFMWSKWKRIFRIPDSTEHPST